MPLDRQPLAGSPLGLHCGLVMFGCQRTNNRLRLSAVNWLSLSARHVGGFSALDSGMPALTLCSVSAMGLRTF